LSQDFLGHKKNVVVWVAIDRLTKLARILSIRINYSMDNLAQLYFQEIVRLHGVRKIIVSDRESRFISRFWKSLSGVLGTKLQPSTVAYPQTNG